MTKTGDFQEGRSRSDFDFTKKAEYVSEDGLVMADKQHKSELNKPVKIQPNSKNESGRI